MIFFSRHIGFRIPFFFVRVSCIAVVFLVTSLIAHAFDPLLMTDDINKIENQKKYSFFSDVRDSSSGSYKLFKKGLFDPSLINNLIGGTGYDPFFDVVFDYGKDDLKSYNTVIPPFEGYLLPDETGELGNPQSWRTKEFLQDWGLLAMKADYAYARGFTGKGVKLGINDTGTWREHEEFNAPNKLFALRVRNLDTKYSYAYVTDGGDPSMAPQVDHGTHVAGTVGGLRNGLNSDGKGFHGVAFDSQLFAAKSSDIAGGLYDLFLANSYKALSNSGVRAINNSWGSQAQYYDYRIVESIIGVARKIRKRIVSTPMAEHLNAILTFMEYQNEPTTLYKAVFKASKAGIIGVFAAGNESQSITSGTATLPFLVAEKPVEDHFLTVVNITNLGSMPVSRAISPINGKKEYGVVSGTSSICGEYNMFWCISAPGTEIKSSIFKDVETKDIYGKRYGEYGNMTGTSMATPHITGALGVIMERYPYMSNAQVRNVLLTTSDHLDYESADYDPIFHGAPTREAGGDKFYDWTNLVKRGERVWIDNNIKVPNKLTGWGFPNLHRAMNGPAQMFGRQKYNLPTGTWDTWTNDISDEAILAYKKHIEEYLIQFPVDTKTADISIYDDLYVDGKKESEPPIKMKDVNDVDIKPSNDSFIAASKLHSKKIKNMYDNRYWKGSLVKLGGGILSIQGNLLYSGPTVVQDGILDIHGKSMGAGNILSGVQVSEKGTIQGNFDVHSSIDIKGKISPGDKIDRIQGKVINQSKAGQINIFGKYTQNKGSVYRVDVFPNGLSDKIVVYPVTIDNTSPYEGLPATPANPADHDITEIQSIILKKGSKVELTNMRGHPGDKVTILKAGRISKYGHLNIEKFAWDKRFVDYVFEGNFDSETVGVKPSAFVDAYLEKLEFRYDMSFKRTRSFDNAAKTGNQLNIARIIQKISSDDSQYYDNGLYGSFVMIPSDKEAQDSLDMLSAPIYGSLQQIQSLYSGHITSAISGHFDDIVKVAREEETVKTGSKVLNKGNSHTKSTKVTDKDSVLDGFSFWSTGYAPRYKLGQTENSLSLSGYGLLAGLDKHISNGWMLGLSLGYNQFSGSIKHSNADASSLFAGVYGGNQLGRFGFDVGILVDYNDFDLNRIVKVGSLVEKPESVFSSYSGSVFGRVKYSLLDLDSSTYINPFVDLNVYYGNTYEAVENPGVTSLKVEVPSSAVTTGILGVRLGANLDGSKSGHIGAMVGVKSVINTINSFSASFHQSKNTEKIILQNLLPVPTLRFVGSVETALSLTDNIDFSFNYSAEIGSGLSYQSFGAGLRVSF